MQARFFPMGMWLFLCQGCETWNPSHDHQLISVQTLNLQFHKPWEIRRDILWSLGRGLKGIRSDIALFQNMQKGPHYKKDETFLREGERAPLQSYNFWQTVSSPSSLTDLGLAGGFRVRSTPSTRTLWWSPGNNDLLMVTQFFHEDLEVLVVNAQLSFHGKEFLRKRLQQLLTTFSHTCPQRLILGGILPFLKDDSEFLSQFSLKKVPLEGETQLFIPQNSLNLQVRNQPWPLPPLSKFSLEKKIKNEDLIPEFELQWAEFRLPRCQKGGGL